MEVINNIRSLRLDIVEVVDKISDHALETDVVVTSAVRLPLIALGFDPIPCICCVFLSRISFAASLAWSLADSILLILIILWSFSSCDSISKLVRI